MQTRKLATPTDSIVLVSEIARLPSLKKPYTPPKPRELSRARAMTIALGFKCSDGIVLAADQELSAKGRHKYHEEKIFPIEGGHWGTFLAYADSPELAKEAEGKIRGKLFNMESRLNEEAGEIVENQTIRSVVESVLVGMAQQHFDELKLQMLVVITSVLERPELWVYDDGGFREADGFVVLGIGDSSLIKYLETAYSPRDSLNFGEKLATYMVAKAKRYIEGCSGPSDVVSIRGAANWKWLPHAEVQQHTDAMESREKKTLREIISD